MLDDAKAQQPIVDLVWREKYRNTKPDGTSEEVTRDQSLYRVAAAVFEREHELYGVPVEDTKAAIEESYNLMRVGAWAPAGRVHAGAGTGRRVTLINCFVSPTIQDSMETESSGDPNSKGIMDALKVAAITQQMGGGIGMDFSPLRPKGAVVHRTGSISDGPLKFMRMWDAMCSTIMSSGSRRGAMMGTLADDHPDIIDFIEAKHDGSALRNFNLSVLVSDKLMNAVKANESWELGHTVPRADGKHERVVEGADAPVWYVYKTMAARELWDKIIRSTYVHAEPGVIFIDRINKRNPLWYCETIRCTNPCGEQPLPPNGDCNLGAVNLAVMVENPFGSDPNIKWDLLERTVRHGVRFLDNVLDVTSYPTDQQKNEALSKRRIGLGVTGLGTMLQMMKVRYGSEEAVRLTKKIMCLIRDQAYLASIELAKSRGSFPLFNVAKYSQGYFFRELIDEIKDRIVGVGLRNGVLLTIAPTGTTSIYYGNPSSGCEPTYDWVYHRKVLKSDGTFEQLKVEDYGYRVYKDVMGFAEDDQLRTLPAYMVTAHDLTVREHLVMQATCQKFVDSSISKTINCPEEMSFEEFKDVYTMAYDLGLKGCTTYRPDPRSKRGAVLTRESDKREDTFKLEPRPEVLQGATYKIKAPGMEHAMYVTINNHVHDSKIRPHEIFINSKYAHDRQWTDALTRTISAVMRLLHGEVGFLAEELKQVHAATGGVWMGNKYIPSMPALIGGVLEQHLIGCGSVVQSTNTTDVAAKNTTAATGDRCPLCSALAFIYQEGCWKCLSCGHNMCG